MSKPLSSVDFNGHYQLVLNPDLYDYLFVTKYEKARRSSSSSGGFLSLAQLQTSNPVVALEQTISTPQSDGSINQNSFDSITQQRSTLCLLANSNEALQQAHKYLIDHAQRLSQTGRDAREAWDSIVPKLLTSNLQIVSGVADSHVSHYSSASTPQVDSADDCIVIDDAGDSDEDSAPARPPGIGPQSVEPDFTYELKATAISEVEPVAAAPPAAVVSSASLNASGFVSSIAFSSTTVVPLGLSIPELPVPPSSAKSPSTSDNANNNRDSPDSSTSTVNATVNAASTSNKTVQHPVLSSDRVLRSQTKGPSVSEPHSSSVGSTSSGSREQPHTRFEPMQLDDLSVELLPADCSFWHHLVKKPAASHFYGDPTPPVVLPKDHLQFFGFSAIIKKERQKAGGRQTSSSTAHTASNHSEGKSVVATAKSKTKSKAKAKSGSKTPARLRSRSVSSSASTTRPADEKLPSPRRVVPCWQKDKCPHKKSGPRYLFCASCSRLRNKWKKKQNRKQTTKMPAHSISTRKNSNNECPTSTPNIKLEDASADLKNRVHLHRSRSSFSKSSERRQSETRLLNETAPECSAVGASTGVKRGGRRGRPPVNFNRRLSDSRFHVTSDSPSTRVPDMFEQMNEIERSAHPTNPEEDEELDEPMRTADSEDSDVTDDSSDSDDEDVEDSDNENESPKANAKEKKKSSTEKNKKKKKASPTKTAASNAKKNLMATKNAGTGTVSSMRELLRGSSAAISPSAAAPLTSPSPTSKAGNASDANTSPASKFYSCGKCKGHFSSPQQYAAHAKSCQRETAEPPAKRVRLDLNSTGKSSSASTPILGPGYTIPRKTAPSIQPDDLLFHIAPAISSSSLMNDAFPVTPSPVFHLQTSAAASSGASDNCSSSPAQPSASSQIVASVRPQPPALQLSQTSTSAYGGSPISSAFSSSPLPPSASQPNPEPEHEAGAGAGAESDAVIVVDSDSDEAPASESRPLHSGAPPHAHNASGSGSGSGSGRLRRLSSDSSDDGAGGPAPNASQRRASPFSTPEKRTAPNGLTLSHVVNAGASGFSQNAGVSVTAQRANASAAAAATAFIKQSPTINQSTNSTINGAMISQQQPPLASQSPLSAPPPPPPLPRASALFFGQQLRATFQSRTNRLMQAAVLQDLSAAVRPPPAPLGLAALAVSANAYASAGAKALYASGTLSSNSPAALPPNGATIAICAPQNLPRPLVALPDTSGPPPSFVIAPGHRLSAPFQTGLAPQPHNCVPSNQHMFQHQQQPPARPSNAQAQHSAPQQQRHQQPLIQSLRVQLLPPHPPATISNSASNLPPASNSNAMPRPAVGIAAQYGVNPIPLPPPIQAAQPVSNSNVPPPARRSAVNGVRCPVEGCTYEAVSQLVINAHLKVAHKDLPNQLLEQMQMRLNPAPTASPANAAPPLGNAQADWKPSQMMLQAQMPPLRIDSLPRS